MKMSTKRKQPNSSSNNAKKPKNESKNSTNDSKIQTSNTNAGHWSLALLKSMEDPKCIVESDDKVVVIKDAYPKAEYHYLVLAKSNISSLKVVTKDHLELLKHMHTVGENIAKREEHKGKSFKLGYHAEPSMVRLHLHVISDDMNSQCLKNKKHWNSFTTKFFLDSKDVCDTLETKGKVQLFSKEECKDLMNQPLACHKCSFIPKNLPDLKKHILCHIKK